MGDVHRAMIQWSRSGMIPGVTQVKNYHPPMPDPITGVLVNFPATVHSANFSNKRRPSQSVQPIDTMPESPNSFGKYNVKEYNDHNGLLGASAWKAKSNIPINSVLEKYNEKSTSSNHTEDVKKLVQTIYGNLDMTSASLGKLVLNYVPPGFVEKYTLSQTELPYKVYEGPGANVVYVLNANVSNNYYPTVTDMAALAINVSPMPRIIDTKEGANYYYSSKPITVNLDDAQKSDMAARSTDVLTDIKDKVVAVSGVPAAIPGLHNIVLADEDPRNRPFIKPRYDSSFIVAGSYNKDLPISPVNKLPITVLNSNLSDAKKGNS